MPATLAEKIAQAGKQIEGERRTVTVLFADITGFTAIAEKLDPEQVYEFISQIQRIFNDEIYKHEGWVDRWMGDGMMALFGAPVMHEDDPARAVRAALGMQDALRKANIDLQERLNITLRVRIGLHSGPVVVASVGSDLRMEYTALGDTVNVASRLQGAAEPGSILVSRSVFDPTEPLFEFRKLGAIQVKNRTEPIETFEAIAPHEKVGRVRGIPGLAAPMVGRGKELGQLRHLVDKLVNDKRGHIVLVTGDAGIGKSRLTVELKSYVLQQPVAILEGACHTYNQPAYGVFLQLLKTLFAIGDDDSEDAMRAKIVHATQRLFPAQSLPDVLPYIEYLFSLRILEKDLAARIRHLTPPQLQQQTFLAVRELLVAQAQLKPLVLILDDIHWIDQLSLELLISLLPVAEQVPLLFYCNSRPTEGTAAPQMQKLGNELYATNFLHLALVPLSQADSLALMDLLLTIPELPDNFKMLIPQRSEGNPFYLEEILRMLIDRGIIRRVGERWQLSPDADVSGLQVPSTLQGLIMTRVDHLSESARQTLQCAAVIGRNFSFRLLSDVLKGEHYLDEGVRELEDHELLSHDSLGSDWEFRFRHILIQETVYNSLLVRRREWLHHKIAESIESLYRDHEEQTEALAFHFAASKDVERAFPYLLHAGQRAADQFANEEALYYYRQSVDFMLKTTPTLVQRINVYAGLGSVQSFVGDYDGAINSYRTTLELSRSTNQSNLPISIPEIMRRIGRVYERHGDYAQALRWMQDSMAELEHAPIATTSLEERARIYNDIGWVHYRRGEFEQAYQWRMQSLQTIAGTEHYSEMASAYAGLVALFTQKGDWTQALTYGEKGLKLRETIGDTAGVSQSHTSLGTLAIRQSEWNRALYHWERALTIKEKIGDISGIARLYSNLGFLHLLKGDYARALQDCQKALAIAEKIQSSNLISLALINLAHVRILQNQFDAAQDSLNRGIELAKEMGSKELVAEGHWLLAEAHLGNRQLDSATTLVQQAITLSAEIGSKQIQGQALCTFSKIASVFQDWDSAEKYIQQSIQILTAINSPFELAKSQYQLAVLKRQHGAIIDSRKTLEIVYNVFARLGAEAECRQVQSDLAQYP
jgi:class 3 adenylate cyclase/predicted ATPase